MVSPLALRTDGMFTLIVQHFNALWTSLRHVLIEPNFWDRKLRKLKCTSVRTLNETPCYPVTLQLLWFQYPRLLLTLFCKFQALFAGSIPEIIDIVKTFPKYNGTYISDRGRRSIYNLIYHLFVIFTLSIILLYYILIPS